MSTLYVIRHAQASMFAANYDELSARGREQARTLGAVLGERFAAAERQGFDAVFCGPARRHLDTAALAGEGLSQAARRFPEPQVLEGFDEHDGQGMVLAALASGSVAAAQPELTRLAEEAADASVDRRRRSKAWQLLFEAIMRRWLRGELELDPRSGHELEPWPEFRERVRAAFAELRERARGEVALFTSVGPTAVILAEILDLPPECAFEQAWRLYNTSITRVVYSGDRMTLDGFNEVAHLPLKQWTHR